MEYLALVLAIAAGVAGIYAAIMAGDNRVKAKIIADQKGLLDTAAKDKARMQAELDDAVARRERVIIELKSELSKAEADLAAASTPDAVRNRLSKLFP